MQRARLQQQTMDANEQLVLSGLRQHELREVAEKLNEQLRTAQAQLADRAVQLEGMVAERTAELTTAHRQLLREVEERKRLEGQVAQAVETEQLRLGQELHDGLVQELNAASLVIDTLQDELAKTSPIHAQELNKVHQMLVDSVNQARKLASGFYPVDLVKHGLAVALRELARRTQDSSGVSCAVETGGHFPAESKDARAIQLFRIAQEAVHNATKHAHARHILIHLTASNGAWLLQVKDDGVGLPPPAGRRQGGMGTHIMQHRAGLIGGTLEVRNGGDGGVVVSCSVPDPKAK